MLSTYSLLTCRHGRPPSLTLLLDSTLGRIGSEVVGDDGAGGLHVKEVGSQRALGSIGVVLPLFTLLLDLLAWPGHRGSQDIWHDGQSDVGQVHAHAVQGAQVADILHTLAEADQKIGLAKVVLSEGPNEVVDALEPRVNCMKLLVCGSMRFMAGGGKMKVFIVVGFILVMENKLV